MPTSTFPPFDHSRFAWHASTDDPSKYKREITGCEVAVELLAKNLSDISLFFVATASSRIGTLPPAEAFTAYARIAWANVRRKIPTVAAYVEHDDAGSSYLVYRVPDSEQLGAWLDRTAQWKASRPWQT